MRVLSKDKEILEIFINSRIYAMFVINKKKINKIIIAMKIDMMRVGKIIAAV